MQLCSMYPLCAGQFVSVLRVNVFKFNVTPSLTLSLPHPPSRRCRWPCLNSRRSQVCKSQFVILELGMQNGAAEACLIATK